MAVLVKYNDQILTPSPFVSESVRSNIEGNYVYQTYDFSLNGFVTGNIDLTRDTLLNVFSGDFKEFFVSGQDILLTGYSCVVRNVSFAPSWAMGVGSYTIDLECYKVDDFGSGVINPSNEWGFQEGRGGVVDISHKISAQGINLSGSPYGEAKAFVESFAGAGTFISGRFGRYSNIGTGDLELFSSTRSANNAAGSYSIEELYKVGMTGVGITSTVTQYNFDISSGIAEDYTTVSVSAEQECAPNCNITGFLINAIDFYNLAANESRLYTSLNRAPVSFNFNLVNTNKAQYQISFIDDTLHTYFDYTQSYQFDNVTQVTDIDINGVIKAKGPVKQRFLNVSGYYYATNCVNGIDIISGDIGVENYLHSFARDFYSSLGGGFSLNNKAMKLSKKENPYKGEIELGATFSDKDHITGFIDANWSVDITLPVQTIIPRSSCLVTGLWQSYNAQINNRQRINVTAEGSYIGSTSFGDLEITKLLKRVEYIFTGAQTPATDNPINLVLEGESKSFVSGSVHNISRRREFSFDKPPFINIV